MTGKVRGLATLVAKETTAKRMIRVWCGLHQLDLAMGRVHETSMGGTFQSTLTAAIGHLRRQQSLITRMRTTCPKEADTRWMSMFKCTSWFTTNIITIQEHFKTKMPAPNIIPDRAWWVFLFAVNSLTQEANTVFTKLQGMTTLLSQQRASLEKLVTTFCTLTGMEGPFSVEVIERLDETERLSMETHSGFCLRHSATESYLVELDP
jgi:dipeptidase